MSQSISPSYNRDLAPKEDEDGTAYQRRLALLRAKRQFPNADPEEVVKVVEQQRLEALQRNTPRLKT